MRNVPSLLQLYMLGHGLHMTRICRLGPFRDGSFLGLAFLDRNVLYDDGEVEVEYIARTGMQMSDFVSSSDLRVDNAEAQTLQPVDGFEIEGITQEQIQAGYLDSVPFIVYAVNYKDLSLGHFIWSAGTIGDVRMPGTALINLEQRSITNKLLQLVGEVDSTTCRAKRLGTQDLGQEGVDSYGDTIVTERFPCRYDVSVENIETAVTGIDADEPDMIFQSTDLLQAEQYFAPGTVLFRTGANIGIEREIENFESGIIQLKVALPYPAEAGDQFRIRRECTFYPIGHNSCQTFWGSSWVIHFRGEPLIPVSDAAASLMSGVAVPTDIGGTGEPLPTNEPDEPPPDVPPPPAGGDSGGVGSTERTHGATVRDPVNYGGGPGQTAATNSAAFAAAYAALPGDGGIVRPSVGGTWMIDPASPIRPKNFTFLDLVTANVKLKSEYSSTITKPSVHRDVIRIDGVHEVEIAVNELEGYLTAWTAHGGKPVHGVSEWAQGIYATNGSYAITIRDATIYNCVGDCISIGYSCDDVVIHTFDLSVARRQGISIACDNFNLYDGSISYISGTIPQCGIDIEPDNNNDATNGVINNLHIFGNAAYGILVAPIDGGGINIDIQDCTVESNSRGIVIGPSAVNCSITGCTIRHNRNPGVWLQAGSSGTVISGNTFWDNSTGSTPDAAVESSKSITGITSEVTPHIQKQSGASATIGANTYQK